MKRIESWFARVFLLVVSFAISFWLLEIAATWYLFNQAPVDVFNRFASINQLNEKYGEELYSRTFGDAGSIWTPHYFAGYIPTANYVKGENRHNSLGFRGDEFDPVKPENVYRIVALGGSTTYGSDVEDFRDSYPTQLGTYLHEQDYDQVEGINGGVGGYTSHQSLINLLFRVLPIQPDLVVFYQGYNDIHTRFVFPFEDYQADNSGYHAPRVSATVMPSVWEYSTVLRSLGILFGLSRPHSDIDRHLSPRSSVNYTAQFTDQWRRGVYPRHIFTEVSALEMLRNNPPIHYERNLRNMIAAAREHDVDVLLVTFVTSTDFDEPSVASEEYIFALEQQNEVTRAVAESTNSPLFDLAAVFPDEPSLFADGRHMTREGNRVRAELIGDYIIERFLQ